jgi:adenine phosphoribosyltransferase
MEFYLCQMESMKNLIRDVADWPKPGVGFKDITPLLASPHFPRVIDALEKLTVRPDFYVGIESRGFLFASALAQKTGAGLLLCRKKGKLPPPTVATSYSLEYGEDVLEMQPGNGTVVIVDDVFATGGTMRAATELCAQAGYTVVDRLVLIDLLFLHEEVEVKSLIQYAE